MLQIRVSTPAFDSGINFADQIILERADDITLKKSVNSSDEGISFTIPLNDAKLSYVNYLRWWECWDTDTNQRLNYGPINTITRSSGDKMRVEGPGRSAVLADFYKTIQTFYYPINQFLDNLRYENIAIEPRTSTIINQATDSQYYGLSSRTKDYVIDEQTGYLTIGRDIPARGTIKTNQYWSGVGRSDWLTIDLGEKYIISKARVLLPWWGGPTINNNRAYDWSLNYSNDNSSFTNLYSTPTPSYHIMKPEHYGRTIYMGETGFDLDQVNASGLPSSIEAQYWKLNITGTHAWYGSIFTGVYTDEWDWECNESDVYNGEARESPTISGGVINKTELTPSNDCYASAIEIELSRKIIGRDSIPNYSYHQIENDNRQITYVHYPEASEMITAGSSKKYEPGNHFRLLTVTTDSGDVEIIDEWNNTIYNGAPPTNLTVPANTSFLLFKGTNPGVYEVDTWPSVIDVFSYGGTYAYSRKLSDTAVLHFRGVSLKWFVTVPLAETPGAVHLEYRYKIGSTWSAWSDFAIGTFYWNGVLSTTDSSNLTLPSDVSAHKVFEITYESGVLQDDTSYEFRISKLDNNFTSIDAFAGFWSASYSDLNEDDPRIAIRVPNEAVQIFDQKLSNASAYKFLDVGGLTKQGVSFMGDRAIVYSRKGPDYGIIRVALLDMSTTPVTLVYIPGTANGYVEVDLNNSYDISQFVILDTNISFASNPLPWGYYRIGIYKPDDPDPMWVDGVGLHETSGLSVKFVTTNHLEILKNTAEALQLEWDVTENGIRVVPRIGTDTNEIFAEGRGTTIGISETEDVEPMASMLLSTGADIDGLPLTAVVEDKNTRRLIGRTIQRTYDLRSTADYFVLIGATRAELQRRRKPQQRLTVKRVGSLPINHGDSFIVKTPKTEMRVRANTITRTQSSTGGTEYIVECTEWPPIV